MISRAALNCFWLYRQMERVESTARLISVTQDYILDVKPSTQESWFPLVIVTGEELPFIEKFDSEAISNGELIQDYLTWDDSNGASIYISLKLARENARTLRDILSLEMWEAINTFWLWMESHKAKKLYMTNSSAFYENIIKHCQLFHGLYHNSILQEEGYDFMRMGMMLERANQTARVMDVKYHRLFPEVESTRESATETVHWLSLLKFCSASEAFLKRTHSDINRLQVAQFLILEPVFPRAILCCLRKANFCLNKLKSEESPVIGEKSSHLMTRLIDSLESTNIEEIFNLKIHDELTRIVNTTSQICNAIHSDFFEEVSET